MQHADLRKFLRDLPLAIALLALASGYLLAFTARYAGALPAEHVHDVIAMAE